MANKVLSIKMDEKDIEKIKKYYAALTEAGFLSSETMSLNAFYKHLLLDYLEDDVNRAFATYSNYGISPRCINPEQLNDNESFTLTNTYNLDTEMFEIYKKCVKEALNRSVDRMKENAGLFNEVVKSGVIVTEGWLYEMECIPWEDMNEKEVSFWEDKAFESLDLQEKEYRENGVDGDIAMVEKSSIPAELKQKLISEIVEYEKKRKQNYSIMQGRGIVK